MKCPKCGYLGFDDRDRCKNCGYDFSLIGRQHDAGSGSVRPRPTTPGAPLEAGRADAHLTRGVRPGRATPDGGKPAGLDRRLVAQADGAPMDLPLFGDDPGAAMPPPRPPLSVRRPTPTTPRARTRVEASRAVELELDLEHPAPPRRSTPAGPAAEAADQPADQRTGGSANAPSAGVARRTAAAAVDLMFVALIDIMVLYFTLRLCGLRPDEIGVLPLVPLLAFLTIMNGGYVVLFTGTLGQTLGKMALDLRVVPQDCDTMDLPRALLRTGAGVLSVLPAGLGLLPAAFGTHRTLHDRLARTRVIHDPAQ